MWKYIVKRLITAAFVIWGVSFVTFIMLFLVPGDPAVVIAGLDATEEAVAVIREQMHLNEPLWIQYLIYMEGLLKGDFGLSIRSFIPVIDLVVPRIFNTLLLATLSMILASIVGVLVGVVSALKRGSVLDTATMSLSIIGICAPSFFTGLVLLYVFAWQLRILPSLGLTSPLSIVLPAINLALWSMANIARLSRTSMIEILGQDYIRTMKAMGLPSKTVNLNIALRNARLEQ
jgi:ABC-type dipeptide/oligopeptide/nickel transport system permease component